MKIIVAGATGYIGGEILRQALDQHAVTAVVALTRRPLHPAIASNPKLKAVIMDDEAFMEYPDHILKELEGAQGCAWAIGKSKPGPEGFAAYRRSNVDYATAAVHAFASSLPSPPAASPSGGDKPFRFAYVSGLLAERDQARSLWFLRDARRARGALETALAEAPARHAAGRLETFVLRAGFVHACAGAAWPALLGSAAHVTLQELAAAVLESAMYGGSPSTEENASIRLRGQRVLRELSGG